MSLPGSSQALMPEPSGGDGTPMARTPLAWIDAWIDARGGR